MNRRKYQIKDFGIWKSVRAGVIVNGNWLKWEMGADTGVAQPTNWREIREVNSPHLGDEVKVDRVIPVGLIGL